MLQSSAECRRRGMLPILHRPIDHKRPSNYIFLRHESPITAVLAIVPVVAHDEVMSFGNDKLTILHQFPHLQPPLAFQSVGWNIDAWEIVAEGVIRRINERYIRFLQRFA